MMIYGFVVYGITIGMAILSVAFPIEINSYDLAWTKNLFRSFK